VLAFGASNVNQTGGKALYDTSYVHLYDTNKNTLYTQNISGNPPLGRASASGTLGNNKQIIIEPGLAFTYSKNKGPDNECIYYYGGNSFIHLM
jgi:hypothetical protein